MASPAHFAGTFLPVADRLPEGGEPSRRRDAKAKNTTNRVTEVDGPVG
jgi:hypothetical protein